jgi:hypothetical protein
LRAYQKNAEVEATVHVPIKFDVEHEVTVDVPLGQGSSLKMPPKNVQTELAGTSQETEKAIAGKNKNDRMKQRIVREYIATPSHHGPLQ